MVYHLIVAILGIGLLFCGWVWVQARDETREECEGLTNKAACAFGPSCYQCARVADTDDRQENRRPRDSLFPGERSRAEQTSQE